MKNFRLFLFALAVSGSWAGARLATFDTVLALVIAIPGFIATVLLAYGIYKEKKQVQPSTKAIQVPQLSIIFIGALDVGAFYALVTSELSTPVTTITTGIVMALQLLWTLFMFIEVPNDKGKEGSEGGPS